MDLKAEFPTSRDEPAVSFLGTVDWLIYGSFREMFHGPGADSSMPRKAKLEGMWELGHEVEAGSHKRPNRFLTPLSRSIFTFEDFLHLLVVQGSFLTGCSRLLDSLTPDLACWLVSSALSPHANEARTE